jgi:y4mF family transcriptional regulator
MRSIATTKQFGFLIKTTRKANGLTQKELAAACGTGVRFIQELEKGKSTCSLGKALGVVNMLGIKFKVSDDE